MTRATHLSLSDRRPWTADEIETVRMNYAAWPDFLIAYLVGKSIHRVRRLARKIGLEKTGLYTNPHARLWSGYEHPNSVASRIKPGTPPPNKGKKMPKGWAPGRMATTQFKKGEMSGAAQHNYVPVGTLRINSKDGYLERKVTDDHPVPARRWVGVHRLVWEAANGPIPAGYRVAFKPGAKTADLDEITIDKLELVTAAEMMRRNTRHNLPLEINQAIQAKACLTRAINRATRGERHV